MGIDPVGVDENNVHSHNRYAYANNNPYRFVDPDGRIPVDTIWDAGNIVYDAGKIAVGYATGNPALVSSGGVDLAADAAAFAIPYVPAGVSKLTKLRGLDDVAQKAVHGNKIDDRPATLYKKFDKDGNFEKHGVTKHEAPTGRYSKKEIDGGRVDSQEKGSRREMLKKERDLVETQPGPKNKERWAGKRSGE